MPSNTEKSFADRLNRARLMHTRIDSFAPPFTPVDTDIAVGAFETFCDDCEAANTAVSDAEADYTTVTGSRSAEAAALQALAGRVQDHVEGVAAWKKYHKSIVDASRAVRGVSAPAKKAAPPAEGAAPMKRARSGGKSQQGYADIAKHFSKLVKAVGKIVGYSAPTGTGMKLTELTASETAYIQLNSNVQDAESALETAQTTRSNSYDGEGGLKEKMKAIKKAVSGQYGRGSDQAKSVSSIAL
jgi:hypothetical protein